MKTRILSALCLLAGALFILFHHLQSPVSTFISKTLIIPPLIILLFINVRGNKNRLHKFMFAGLAFSWLGDILLEFTSYDEIMFVAGLGAFLLAQIMYSTLFFTTEGNNAIFNRRYYLLFPVLIYGIILLALLNKSLGDMRIPVFVYAVTMLVMLTGAINRIEKVNRPSYWLVTSGALLFVISDSFIAVTKFVYPLSFSVEAVMSTYVAAELLITLGYVRQFTGKMK